MDDLSQLEEKLSYAFQDRDLLREALRHRSYVNECPGEDLRDNERFEFLGDAVLDLIVGHLLMLHHPTCQEGDLSRMRAGLVNEASLAEISQQIDLGRFLQLGRGEESSHGREKDSLLANTFEAVIAAIYLDGGFHAAWEAVESFFLTSIRSKETDIVPSDYKSRLQEFAQQRHGTVPSYAVVEETGPDHDKTFRIRLDLDELHVEGRGKSKKAAEQEAARQAIAQLAGNDKESRP